MYPTLSPTTVLVALAVAAIAVPGPAGADPNVIRDDRMADVGITPTLGRGYSPGANSLYSVCFDSMPTTDPSFDFDYEFEQLDTQRITNSQQRGAFKLSAVNDFVRTNASQRYVGRGKNRQYYHYIMATLVVDSYYSSIDEGRAKLSQDALALIKAGDALGFFSGCGTHYIRSIARRSYFLTLFSYTSSSSQRDGSFERQLEQSVRALDVDGVKSQGEQEQAAKFDETARSRNLRIVSKSIGLVAQKETNLIPFDLASYKDTLRAAFRASQDDLVGRITAMEITPWLSNPVVLAAFNLTGPSATAGGAGRFERKQLLSDNAEFYLDLLQTTQELSQLVHKAGVCRQELEQHTLVNGAIPPDLTDAKIVNHRTGTRLPLKDLVDALTDANLETLDKAERSFALGEAGGGGAANCVEQLERGQLTSKSHLDIPACSNIKRPTLPNAALIDDHCMPELVGTP